MISPETFLAQHPTLRPGARVAVGLSGGVDSAMAAWWLKQAGFTVVGLTMSIWDDTLALPDEGRSGCFGPGEARDLAAAAEIARRLDIPHRVVRLAEEYRATVLEYYRREYLAGRTPNPCVHCNRNMKFGFLLDRARDLGAEFDFFATGHYARTAWNEADGRWRLLRAADATKDQTYFLSHLTQDRLAHALFPLGACRKSEVKALAREAGFPELAEKSESQDFIEADDHAVLFEPGDAREGDLIGPDGTVVGRHRGLPFYTIGQRRGLGLGGTGEPWYVTGLDPAANRVLVGPGAGLLHPVMRVSALNWIARAAAPAAPLRAQVKIRQRHAAAPAELIAEDGGATVRVVFDDAQRAITPGQIAVFYDGDDVVGAGTIDAATDA
jgi:tRNA-uridine 2-sulfurtransferase